VEEIKIISLEEGRIVKIGIQMGAKLEKELIECLVKNVNVFTELNKVCPTDVYPLSSIDALVDGVSGCEMLNFMDA